MNFFIDTPWWYRAGQSEVLAACELQIGDAKVIDGLRGNHVVGGRVGVAKIARDQQQAEQVGSHSGELPHGEDEPEAQRYPREEKLQDDGDGQQQHVTQNKPTNQSPLQEPLTLTALIATPGALSCSQAAKVRKGAKEADGRGEVMAGIADPLREHARVRQAWAAYRSTEQAR